MKAMCMFFFGFLVLLCDAQIDNSEVGLCEKTFQAYLFNNFRVSTNDRVDDIIHLVVEIDSKAKLNLNVLSKTSNRTYVSLFESILKDYPNCFPMSGRLEAILYFHSELNKDEKVQRPDRTTSDNDLIKFRKANGLSEDLEVCYWFFGAPTKCSSPSPDNTYRPLPQIQLLTQSKYLVIKLPMSNGQYKRDTIVIKR